jgi:uncharacterized protein
MVDSTFPQIQIDIPRAELAAFCQRWQMTRMELFGSVLRDDFRPDSDVDVLVTFAPETALLLTDWVDMREELAALFGRKVDLIERYSIEHSYNYLRRKAILDSAKVIYAA